MSTTGLRTVTTAPIDRVRELVTEAVEHRRLDAAARDNRNRGTTCFYCGAAFGYSNKLDRTVDHRVPKSRGGHDRLANLVFACRACNEHKADRDEAAFVRCAWLAQRRGQFRGSPPDDP